MRARSSLSEWLKFAMLLPASRRLMTRCMSFKGGRVQPSMGCAPNGPPRRGQAAIGPHRGQGRVAGSICRSAGGTVASRPGSGAPRGGSGDRVRGARGGHPPRAQYSLSQRSRTVASAPAARCSGESASAPASTVPADVIMPPSKPTTIRGLRPVQSRIAPCYTCFRIGAFPVVRRQVVAAQHVFAVSRLR